MHKIDVSIKPMSALPLKADMCAAVAHVSFGPIADIAVPQNGMSALPQRSVQAMAMFNLTTRSPAAGEHSIS
jgi:hypothetical protein